MKYRKKPVVVEAIQWAGNNLEELKEFTHINLSVGKDNTLMIPTLEGLMMTSLADFIIQGVHGEFYPCKPDIFEKTYEPI